MRPMRVAFLSEHASPVALLGGQDSGGQNVYVDEVARSLGRLGHTIDIFTRSGDPAAPPVVDWAPGVRVVNVKVGPPRRLLKDDLWPLMPAFSEAIEGFAARQGVGYDLIHGNFWMSGWAAARLRARLNVPATQIFHAMGLTKRRYQGAADTSPADRLGVERQVVQNVDYLIAQCPSERDELIDGYGAVPGRIALIPAAVNVRRFRPMSRREARRLLDLPPDDFIVTYVGRMVRRKGVRNVVRAVARMVAREREFPALPPVRLHIVGGESSQPDREITPEIGALQDLAAELGIADRLIFAGARPPDELYRYYSAGNVIVTTPWYEPFGLTPLEGMACGRPVIGSAVGGIAFTIRDGVTGFHVPPRDPEALAAQLEHLRSDPALGRQMGMAARARVEKEFTWELTGERTAMLYHTMLYERRLEQARRMRLNARALAGRISDGAAGVD